MQKGQLFFKLPHDHRAHHRMAAILRIYTREKPVSVWEMTCAALGTGRALSLGRRKATHLCERIIRAAELNDFIRRLPLRLPPGEGEPFPKKGFNRALAYTITDDGEMFVRDHDRYMEDKAKGLEGHSCNAGFHRNRNRKRIDKVQAKYLRRMQELTRP